MNKLRKLWENKNPNLLAIYFMAGYPDIESTVPMIEYLTQSEVDIIEIGFPFSDPLADGAVIQAASQKAIQKGMNLKLLFQQLSQLQNISTPLILMGYLNPVLQMGIPQFLEQCSLHQIDGLILPDMPLEFYEKHFQAEMNDRDISSIFLVTPSTPVERLQKICDLTTGFIYVVSDHSITGKEVNFEKQKNYYEKIQNYLKEKPKMIGFGIRDKKSFEMACQYANGAIIGTEFLKFIEKQSVSLESIQKFIQTIKL
ncbi:MAG: tryptophan synthase alpha chain [Bacteroidia bacterium]|nr:MAG: tryptophan synthase alpha chain [Bacteroidia bacterium]